MSWDSLLLVLVAVGLPTSVALMTTVFFIAQRLRRYDIVDIFWGPAICTVTVVSFLAIFGLELTNSTLGQLLILLAVVAWTLRLTIHIAGRFRTSDKQDQRYTELIAKMPTRNRSLHIYLRIFFTQALLATVISLTPLAAIGAMQDPSVWLAIGLLLWGAGLIYELVSDAQLREFLRHKNNHGSILRSGLWRYSRHPNYFGEIVVWFGIFAVSIGSAYWLLGSVGFLVITGLLVFVSGVPQAEKRMARKAGWKSYKKNTSVLVPLPTKKS